MADGISLKWSRTRAVRKEVFREGLPKSGPTRSPLPQDPNGNHVVQRCLEVHGRANPFCKDLGVGVMRQLPDLKKQSPGGKSKKQRLQLFVWISMLDPSM